jgi:tRNA pseudouridine55 synthase
MGQRIERSPREVETYEITLLYFEPPVFRIEVFCSRGLYLRVLAEEIGRALGIPAHLKSLVRTRIGHFSLDAAIPDDAFANGLDENVGYSLSEAMRHLPALEITTRQALDLEHGRVPRVRGPVPPAGTTVRVLRPDGGLGAICDVGEGGALSIRRVFRDANTGGRRETGERT